MQGNDPSGICSRNQNDDSQRNAGIAISGLLQTKAIGEQADENDRDKKCDQIRSKVMRLERSDRRAQGRRDDALDGERQRRAETRLHHDQSGNCCPISLGHLHQSRDDYRQRRRGSRADRVRNRWKILFLPVPVPEFHASMILLAIPFWQDRARGNL